MWMRSLFGLRWARMGVLISSNAMVTMWPLLGIRNGFQDRVLDPDSYLRTKHLKRLRLRDLSWFQQTALLS